MGSENAKEKNARMKGEFYFWFCTILCCLHFYNAYAYFWSVFESRGAHLSGVELIILLSLWHI